MQPRTPFARITVEEQLSDDVRATPKARPQAPERQQAVLTSKRPYSSVPKLTLYEWALLGPKPAVGRAAEDFYRRDRLPNLKFGPDKQCLKDEVIESHELCNPVQETNLGNWNTLDKMIEFLTEGQKNEERPANVSRDL